MANGPDKRASESVEKVKPLGRRPANTLGFVMLGAALLAAALLVASARPLLVPYWYALSRFDPSVTRLLFPVTVLVVYGLVAYCLRAGPSPATILWALVGGIALPVVCLTLLGDPLEVLLMRTISSQATGGFSMGVELTGEMMRNWPQLMADWRQTFPHVAISLPGWPLLYAGFVRLFEAVPSVARALASPLRALQCQQWGFNTLGNPQIASAWLGVASPLWSALTVAPLCALGWRIGGKPTALFAVLLWPLVPAAALFVGALNSVYPLFATIVVLGLWAGVTASPAVRRVLLLIAAGALSAGLIVLNLALVPLLLFCGLLTLALPWMDANVGTKSRLLRAVVSGLWFGVGAFAVFAAYRLLARHSPLQVIAVALRVHFGMERAYLPGLGLHLWDFVLFVGLPLVVLALIGAAFRSPHRRLPEAVHVLAAALGLTLLILLVSGAAQGEVGRVWSFFMPFVVLLAAHGLRRLPRGSAALFLAAQGVWLLALVGTTAPVDTWLGTRPSYADVAPPALPVPLVPADARFGDLLQLTGFQSAPDAARKELRVALHWKVLQQMDRPYYFSAVLVGPDGRVLPGVNWQPFQKRFPTICWMPGQSELVDEVALPLDAGYITGSWWLSLSAFSLEGNQAPVLLLVTVPGAAPDKQVGLGPLPVR